MGCLCSSQHYCTVHPHCFILTKFTQICYFLQVLVEKMGLPSESDEHRLSSHGDILSMSKS